VISLQGSSVRPQDGVRSAANRQRALIALVQVLALSVWFSASAVVPTLRIEWDMGAAAAVWLTASVQVGFVLGAVGSVVLNLADRFPPQLLLALSALLAAACTAILAVFVNSLAFAVPLRLLTGLFLAGVYPVGLKLMASWSGSASRGRAFGILVGALTLGSALPHLISAVGKMAWTPVMATAAGITASGAVICACLVRPGPYLDTRPIEKNPRYVLTMFRERGPRLVNLGYFGHMWELYALWTWLPMYLLASRAGGEVGSSGIVEIGSFAAIGLAGLAGCLLGGYAADRWGRPASAAVALAVSGACCLLSPLFFLTPAPVLFAFVLVWGAAVIADSGVFSTSLSETVDPRYVGTALTAQTAIGFLLTVVTIQLVPVLAELVGWQYAFLLLVPGPIVGVRAMQTLGRRMDNSTPTEVLR